MKWVSSDRYTKACAKAMLADRHGGCIPLWIAFARLERSSGRKQASRKVYDRVINKLPSLLPREAAMHAATLALACAEDELLDGEMSSDSSGRALGALVWLAEFSLGVQSGETQGEERSMESFPGGATTMPPLRLLQVRRGLQELVGGALAGGGSGLTSPIGGELGANLQPEGVAAVAAAALFEQLVSGVDTASAVFTGAFAAAPVSAQRAAALAPPAPHPPLRTFPLLQSHAGKQSSVTKQHPRRHRLYSGSLPVLPRWDCPRCIQLPLCLKAHWFQPLNL
jgi:hypothetical protein